MKTLTARFTETTTSSLLTKADDRARPGHRRASVTRRAPRYAEPDVRVVLIDGNKMTIWWPSRNMKQVTDIGTAQGRVQK